MDFVSPEIRTRNGRLQIFPSFKVKRTKDLMIRGRSFYAVWDEGRHIWSRDESDLSRLVDEALSEFAEEQKKVGNICDVLWMNNFSSGSWQSYQQYLHTMFDTYIPLDSKVTFLSQERERKDYVSKRLPYDLETGVPEAYEQLMSTLYSKEERRKLEWAVGSVLNGDGKNIQKFIVLYGQSGAGKSTFLHIVEQLFAGYWTNFDAKSLTNNQAFSTHFFKDNPLVAIQHDVDLSRIEDNSTINSIIAHEEIVVNEKFKAQYTDKSLCFLFLGTNSPVKITDAKSGLIRRLIDVSPTGNLLPLSEYQNLMDRIPFELGKIANKCLNVYRHFGKKYYDDYRPMAMMYLTDPFFNFVDDNIDFFCENDPVSLNHAYDVYKNYCENSKSPFILQKYKFREELKNYFEDFLPEGNVDGKRFKSVYFGFIKAKFSFPSLEGTVNEEEDPTWLILDQDKSLLDKDLSSCLAQYSTADGKPMMEWKKVRTTLSEIDTSKCHYVKPDLNHIVIDFDIKNSNGEKDSKLNLEAASKFPPTYAEYSQGGHGIHLHYIYDGDATKLSRVFGKDIEIKVFNGGSSLRRKVTKCNNLQVAHISTGLPVKEEKKVINPERVRSEQEIRALILKNLRKEIHPNTKPSMDFIFKILEDAYSSKIPYDVRDLRPKCLTFAMKSTNQADACLKLLNSAHFCSDDYLFVNKEFNDDVPIIFLDCEVFPNLFLINWKYQGAPDCVHMINPSPKEVGELFKYRIIGFNNRRYDNHIMYARYLGYNNEELFRLSNKIINKKQSDGFFKEAYNISYTDIYDFASSVNKKSLKKWEIELGIHHQELGLPWDAPVPEEKWDKVSEYCDNDVKSTEMVFDALKGDWLARQMLAKLAGGTVNDTTNQLTTKFIFGNDRSPRLVYTDLKTGKRDDGTQDPIFFPDYDYVDGKNMFRGEDLGKGGYVWAVPGMYYNVYTFDVSGMHPASIIAMNYFGDYTPRFKDMVDARSHIKHKELDIVAEMLNGALAEYMTDEKDAKAVSLALKTANNSCYGLSSASFPNPMRHSANKNNIVALRGALTMATLRDELVEKGVQVIHIKTDSIKVVNPSKEVMDYIYGFGKRYGYDFEIEHHFDRLCLVNDSVYIAKLANDDPDGPGKWTATGAQFQQGYVFKKLFSKEEMTFDDVCEVREVKVGALYLDMNEGLGDSQPYLKELKKTTDEERVKELTSLIDSCHNYNFVGRIGRFCPIKEGRGGGELVVKRDEKYSSASSASGYRWLESEAVSYLSKEDDIDISYYNRLVDEAVDTISKYGDFEAFVSES